MKVTTMNKVPKGPVRFDQWNALRKANPKLYYSASTQKRVHKSATVLGEDFYKPTEVGYEEPDDTWDEV